LDGDGFEPPDELQTLVNESAGRVGLPAPLIEKVPSQENPKKDGGYKRDPSVMDQISHLFFHPAFPINASPIHISHGIRKWRDSRNHRADLINITNAVGWRLMEMVEVGNEEMAESAIRQIANNLPRWDAENFLPFLADGLALRGQFRLAALVSTLAYTRTSDGWRSFAGPEGVRLFTKAIELDPLIAWSTLANEVSDFVAKGGDHGVNAHLIELLLAGGRVDEAFDTWESACNSILLRVPPTGPRDEIDIPYDYESEKPADTLVAVIFSHINHCFCHEKRLAVTAASLAISFEPSSFASAFKFALANNIPSSTLITLLQVIELYEPESYPVTQMITDELCVIATGDLVSARVLARKLLERAGVHFPIQPPIDLPFVPTISDERTSDLRRLIGENRIRRVEEFWPGFGERVTRYVDLRLKSDELRTRMQRTLHRINRRRKGRNLQVWLPVDEEVERTVQITGTMARTELARNGILDPNIEESIGLRLLGDVDIPTRLMFSRIVRPMYLPKCSQLQVGRFVTEPISVPDGEFAGWIILAHYETELLVGDNYDKPVTGKIEVLSGLQYSSDWQNGESLPLGIGYLAVWSSKVPSSLVHVPFSGPLVGLNFTHDTFGVIQFIVPHPIVQVAGQLEPAPFSRGLKLLDSYGKPAVVCSYWRQKLIDTTYEADQEPRVQGMQILARPDILENISNYTLERAEYGTSVIIEESDNSDGYEEQ
jgi:hypothetical protein